MINFNDFKTTASGETVEVSEDLLMFRHSDGNYAVFSKDECRGLSGTMETIFSEEVDASNILQAYKMVETMVKTWDYFKAVNLSYLMMNNAWADKVRRNVLDTFLMLRENWQMDNEDVMVLFGRVVDICRTYKQEMDACADGTAPLENAYYANKAYHSKVEHLCNEYGVMKTLVEDLVFIALDAINYSDEIGSRQ